MCVSLYTYIYVYILCPTVTDMNTQLNQTITHCFCKTLAQEGTNARHYYILNLVHAGLELQYAF